MILVAIISSVIKLSINVNNVLNVVINTLCHSNSIGIKFHSSETFHSIDSKFHFKFLSTKQRACIDKTKDIELATKKFYRTVESQRRASSTLEMAFPRKFWGNFQIINRRERSRDNANPWSGLDSRAEPSHCGEIYCRLHATRSLTDFFQCWAICILCDELRARFYFPRWLP